MQEPSSGESLRCTTCELPFAHLSGRSLRIRSRHHGEQHVNELSADYLFQLLRGMVGEAQIAAWLAEGRAQRAQPSVVAP